ncbi:MAG TPA: cardiolipin synthase [Xanthomonadaceae bacterium]|nr:cardiolipin synthase [Xanthomonadaceae bacterium]
MNRSTQATPVELTTRPQLLHRNERCAKRRRRRTLAGFLLVSHVLGFASSLHALMDTRTPQGAIAWVVALNTVPYLSVPAYWVFGRTKFQGYVISRRDLDSELAAALGDTTHALHPFRSHAIGEPHRFGALEALAKGHFLSGNRLQLLIDGEATFSSLFEGIESARQYILVQTYILRDDEVGRALQNRLIEQAEAGLDVYLLYDEIGSYALPNSYVRELTDAGVNVHRFHSTRGSGNRFQLNFRNHRKVLVTDGAHGWLGGFNIGVEYMGKDTNIGAWRDTHLRLDGPAALNLQLSFVEDWYWATGEILELPWSPVMAEGNAAVLVLPSGPADRFDTASLMVQQLIHAARQRIWISSPYFVPDEGVQGMLKLAALSGVDVRILIPEEPDNALLYFAAYAFIGPLLDAGVKVHRYQDGFLHGKAILVDDHTAAITTVNLDNRSFRLNFEISAIVADHDFAGAVESMFRDDFLRSRAMLASKVDEKPFWFRVASRAAYMLAPVL